MNLANMDFLKLDPRYFKAFLAAAEYENFTQAANEAAMTQSGISQHISKLEEQVGAPLFVRTSKSTVLTDSGKVLLQYIKNYNDSVAILIDQMNQSQSQLEGLVRYAMPPSCLLSPHFPMLLERRLKHPGLELKVDLLPNDDILPQLIDGKIDFGFVTRRVDHQHLDYLGFCDEEYTFVTSSQSDIDAVENNNLTALRFIKYPGMDVYFNYWNNHYFPDNKNVTDKSLYHAGEMNSIDGAIKMVVGGLGCSIFPAHCVGEHLEKGELIEYKPASADKPCFNTIYIVSRNTEESPRRVETVINWFMEMH